MKRVILGVLLVLSFNLFGLDHGLISGFEVGFNIKGVNQLSFNDELFEYRYSDSLSIKLTTGYRVENLRIIGTYTNTLIQKKIDSYIPIQDNFKIDINYTWEYFTLGFFHWCDHPVITTNDQRDTLSNSGQRTIYLRFHREF